MLERMKEAKERHDAEKLQKKLIKTKDDEKVVEALPLDEDNSGINFPKVIKSMENPESKYEVIKNNMPEIIGNDNVKDTLEHLEAPYIAKVVEKTQEELQEQGKIKNAIMAAKDNGVKLVLTQKYLEFLTKRDVIDIFETLHPETTEKAHEQQNAEESETKQEEQKTEENTEKDKKEKKEEKISDTEKRKIEIVSQIVLNDFKKSGASWNIKELTNFFDQRSILSILNLTLTNMAGLINERKQKYLQIKDVSRRETAAKILEDLARQKAKIVADLLREVQVEPANKTKILEEYKNQKANLLTEDEVKIVEEYLPEIQPKKKRCDTWKIKSNCRFIERAGKFRIFTYPICNGRLFNRKRCRIYQKRNERTKP